jgi:hypothetical protein
MIAMSEAQENVNFTMRDGDKPKPRQLPVTVQDLEAMRRVFHQPTLNDRVDAIHVKLWANEQYRLLLDGVYDEDCVEGSQAADNLFAAVMIRTYAKDVAGDEYVAGKKAHTIVKALGVVLRRYGISRGERAREVAGQIVNMNGQSS